MTVDLDTYMNIGSVSSGRMSHSCNMGMQTKQLQYRSPGKTRFRIPPTANGNYDELEFPGSLAVLATNHARNDLDTRLMYVTSRIDIKHIYSYDYSCIWAKCECRGTCIVLPSSHTLRRWVDYWDA